MGNYAQMKGVKELHYLLISNHAEMLLRYRGAVIEALLRENTVTVCVPEQSEELEKMGCRVVTAPVDRRGIDPVKDMKLYFNYRRILKELSPDAVITYSIKPNVYGGYAAKTLGIPYFAHVQGLGSAFYKPVLKTVAAVMYKIALKRARGVFFENEGDAGYFVKKRIVPLRSVITVKAGAGVPIEDFPLCPLPKGSATRFLFVGRVMKEKGVDELFSAARRLKNELGDAVSFAVAGGFEESYSETVKELSDEGVIEYLGFVKDVAALYRDCHAVVLPSYHEGLSNVLIEGAATGRALITTSVHGCAETVTDESGILVPPSDADALHFALRSFHGFSYEEKRDMGLKGRAHVEKSFDRADVVTFTLNALRERLDGQGHKTHKKRRD